MDENIYIILLYNYETNQNKFLVKKRYKYIQAVDKNDRLDRKRQSFPSNYVYYIIGNYQKPNRKTTFY